MSENKVEDIFEEVEKTDSVQAETGSAFDQGLNARFGKGKFQKQNLKDTSSEIRDKKGPTKPLPSKSKIIKIISLVLAGIIILAIAYTVWQSLEGADDVSSISTNTGVIVNNLNASAPVILNLNFEIQDIDNDGIPDEDEAEFKTNPERADTDIDGLSDYDEVMVFKTNPIIRDTDGDGFSDGDEVKNGYNPLGDGKLLNFEEELEKINN